MTEQVNGQAAVGDLVTYEDMANPPKTYRVELRPNPRHPQDYVLAEIKTGELSCSDLRQRGWTRKVGRA